MVFFTFGFVQKKKGLVWTIIWIHGSSNVRGFKAQQLLSYDFKLDLKLRFQTLYSHNFFLPNLLGLGKEVLLLLASSTEAGEALIQVLGRSFDHVPHVRQPPLLITGSKKLIW